MSRRNIILWLVTLVILVLVNVMVVQREQVREHGITMLLRLAPVDPRSLIQGDYMTLRYALPNFLHSSDIPSTGQVVVRINDRHVATILRLHVPGTPLADHEYLLQYRERDGTIQFASHAFFFQEGHAHYYETAKYGELRISKSGESVLVGLRDEHLNPLGPPEE